MALIIVNEPLLPSGPPASPSDVIWHYQTFTRSGIDANLDGKPDTITNLGTPIDHGYYGWGLDLDNDNAVVLDWIPLGALPVAYLTKTTTVSDLNHVDVTSETPFSTTSSSPLALVLISPRPAFQADSLTNIGSIEIISVDVIRKSTTVDVNIMSSERSLMTTSTVDMNVRPTNRVLQSSVEKAADVTTDKTYEAEVEFEIDPTFSRILETTGEFSFSLVTETRTFSTDEVGIELVQYDRLIGARPEVPIDPTFSKLLFQSVYVDIEYFSLNRILIAAGETAVQIVNRLLVDQTLFSVNVTVGEKEYTNATPDNTPVLFSLSGIILNGDVEFEASIGGSGKVFVSDEVDVAFRVILKDAVETATSVTFGLHSKVYISHEAHPIVISNPAMGITSSEPISIAIAIGNKVTHSSNLVDAHVFYPPPILVNAGVTLSDIVKVEPTYISSPTAELNYEVLTRRLIESDLQYAQITAIEKYVESNSVLIDVFSIGTATSVRDQDWILMRHLGTEDWKFLSVLNETTTRVRANIGADVRLYEMLSASESKVINYTPFGEVERIVVYTSPSKAVKQFEMYIEYVDEFPFRATTIFYDFTGNRYYATEQSYTRDIDGEIISDGFRVLESVNIEQAKNFPGVGVWVPSLVAVDILDVVYVNGTKIDKASSSAYSSSQVLGVVTDKSTPTTAIVAQVGVVSGYTGLVTGAHYYLHSTLPGQISITPPAPNSGLYMKKVGIAFTSEQLLLDLSQPVLYRTI